MTESDLTEYVRKDLESLGYTTYAEVCVKGGGDKRCDLYARIEDKNNPKYGYTIAFEAKLSFNLKVIEQSYFQGKRAHETFIICPTTHKSMSSRRFARELCKILGIGVMEVNVDYGKYHITVKPKMFPHPKVPTLYEEQKQTLASTKNGDYVTPFKITVNRINDYMKDKNNITLLQIVKNIKHHYKSDVSGCRAIKHLIETNVIKGFYISKINNKIVIVKEKS